MENKEEIKKRKKEIEKKKKSIQESIQEHSKEKGFLKLTFSPNQELI